MKMRSCKTEAVWSKGQPDTYGVFEAEDGSFKVLILEDGVAVYTEDVPQFSPLTGEPLTYPDDTELEGESDKQEREDGVDE